MKALEELEYLVNSNAEILYHLDFLKECEELYADKNLEVNDEKKYINYIEGEMTYTLTFDSWYLFTDFMQPITYMSFGDVSTYFLNVGFGIPGNFKRYGDKARFLNHVNPLIILTPNF